MKVRPGPLAFLSLSMLLIEPVTLLAEAGSAFDRKAVPAVVSPSPVPETYGTASQTAMMVGSFMFAGRDSTSTLETANGVDRYITTPGSPAMAHPVLPNGALIQKVELRACDTSATDQVILFFGPCPTPGAACTLAGWVFTGSAETPGCGDFAVTITPFQVDNQNPIFLEVSTGTTSATTFSGVKLYYTLQVSPAPSVATFGDVPTTHPFFKFVEALYASGITAGCGGGNFCPDAPLTRGQMAVFLSVALGLHWPN